MKSIHDIFRNKRIENWKKKDFRTSIEYYYAQELKKHNFDPMHLTIWYIDKENDYIQFAANQTFYELRDGSIKEITKDDVWIERNRYNKKRKSRKKA